MSSKVNHSFYDDTTILGNIAVAKSGNISGNLTVNGMFSSGDAIIAGNLNVVNTLESGFLFHALNNANVDGSLTVGYQLTSLNRTVLDGNTIANTLVVANLLTATVIDTNVIGAYDFYVKDGGIVEFFDQNHSIMRPEVGNIAANSLIYRVEGSASSTRHQFNVNNSPIFTISQTDVSTLQPLNVGANIYMAGGTAALGLTQYAAARVDFNGVFTNLAGIQSVTNPSIGEYYIEFSNAFPVRPIVLVTPENTILPYTTGVKSRTEANATINTFLLPAGILANVGFSVLASV